MARRKAFLSAGVVLTAVLAGAGFWLMRRTHNPPPMPVPVAERAPREAEIRSALELGVARLVAMQNDDGSWPGEDNQPSGLSRLATTALAVQAIMDAQRRVKFDNCAQAIHKGLTFIVQQWPEPKTKTAGLVLPVLVTCDEVKYRRFISMYAWMTVRAQIVYGPHAGTFGDTICPFPKDFDSTKNYSADSAMSRGTGNSLDTQFGIMAMLAAEKGGFQMPKVCWLRAWKHYAADNSSLPTLDAMLAGALLSGLTNERLNAGTHDQCRPMSGNETMDRGVAWVDAHFNRGAGLDAFGWWTCGKLGRYLGRSRFGGTDWYEAGAAKLIRPVSKGTGGVSELAFAVSFLGRGLDRLALNKLRYPGDGDLHRHDVAHAAEYIEEKFCRLGRQWREATFDDPLDEWLRAPVLWIAGHEALAFTPAQKQKLKDYVSRGGTIFAEACCGKEEFDASFRALVAELWPDGRLEKVPEGHALLEVPRPLTLHPDILGLALDGGKGRIGVVYMPHGISCQWERGGVKAYPALDVAAHVFFYADHYFLRAESWTEK